MSSPTIHERPDPPEDISELISGILALELKIGDLEPLITSRIEEAKPRSRSASPTDLIKKVWKCKAATAADRRAQHDDLRARVSSLGAEKFYLSSSVTSLCDEKAIRGYLRSESALRRSNRMTVEEFQKQLRDQLEPLERKIKQMRDEVADLRK